MFTAMSHVLRAKFWVALSTFMFGTVIHDEPNCLKLTQTRFQLTNSRSVTVEPLTSASMTDVKCQVQAECQYSKSRQR